MCGKHHLGFGDPGVQASGKSLGCALEGCAMAVRFGGSTLGRSWGS